MGLGEANEGQPPMGAPMLVAGYYAVGDIVFRLRTDSSGNLLVSGNIGGGANVGLTGATAPTSAGLDGGTYNSSPITLTNGQMGALQLDANGYLKITGGSSGANIGLTGAAAPTSASLDGGTFLTVLPTLTNGQMGSFQLDSSGRLIISPTTNQSVNVAQVNGVTTLTGTGAVGTGSQRVAVGTDTATIAGSAPGTAGTASAQVVTVQGVASMTKLLVTPDSVALPANQSVNNAQVNGVTLSTGTGAVGTGSQRVAVGTDTATIAGSAPGTAGSASANVLTVQGVASMTKLLVTPDSVALPANQSVNVAQMNGVATSMGNGTTDTGTQRVTLSSDSTGQTKTTDGTTVANVAPGTGAQTGQAALQIAGTNQAQAFTFSSASNGTTYDVSSYKSVSVQIAGNASANTITIETSNDNGTTWTVQQLQATDGTNNNTGASTITSATLKTYAGNLACKWFRLRCSTYVSGSTTGTIVFQTMPNSFMGLSTTFVGQSGTWTVQPGNTANTTPWLMTPAAGTTGGYSFLNLAANATTTVKSGAGTLHSITINTLGTADTITVYDNTAGSGTKIATINAAVSQSTLMYDLAFATGLTLVIAGTTAPDITVNYK